MNPAPKFASDLYRGTASYYDRYRPPYPDELFDDLRQRLPLRAGGRVLDLACGTGQMAFPLARHSGELVAVDQEEESVAFGQAKAEAAGVTNIVWVTGSAETVYVAGQFELITIGNAYHRLDRPVVARRMRSWLSPDGGVALVWADTPSQGDQSWQKALEELFVTWMAKVGTTDRVPAGWQADMQHDPHERVLQHAGFDYVGKFEFIAEQIWTVETLVGFAYSTSLLNRNALGDMAAEFEQDSAQRLGPFTSDGTFRQQVGYAYELARITGRGPR